MFTGGLGGAFTPQNKEGGKQTWPLVILASLVVGEMKADKANLGGSQAAPRPPLVV